MARKKRKSPVGKMKKSRASIRKTTRHSKARRPRKRRQQGLGKVRGAYRTVVDTIEGTDQLRNKMEPPATSETE
jgi:hypothetical protein